MVNTNELKRGNFIFLDEKHFGKIIAITEKIITTENQNNIYTDGTNGDDWLAISDYITPVPLTPEILERCGFEKVKNGIGLKTFEGYVFISYLFNCFPLVLDIDDNRMPLHNIQYLHQLQNLYFALSRTELEVNLHAAKEGVQT